MKSTEIKELEEKLRVLSTGVWSFDPETGEIKTGSDSIHISTAPSGQTVANVKFMVESPAVVKTLLVEVESKIRDVEYWKGMAQRALSESRSTKLDTIKGCIRLLRTIYLPTRMARDVINQAKKLLEEFKTKDLSEMIDRQDDTLVFDDEPPQVP